RWSGPTRPTSRRGSATTSRPCHRTCCCSSSCCSSPTGCSAHPRWSACDRGDGGQPVGLRGRPELYTSYASDMALLNTPAKRNTTILLVAVVAALPLLLTDDLLVLFGRAMAFAIGAIGLNLVTGYAGQVSLGHAFFV